MSDVRFTVYNENSTGHKTEKYPLFFGEQMGSYDTVHRNYPTIFDLYNKQMGQIWYPTEVSVEQDKVDLLRAPQDVVDLMSKTIQWQQATDSIASRSVGVLLEPWVTNPEMSSLIKAWGLFEDIHSISYADIVASVFPNPSDMIEEIVEDLNIVARSRILIDVFDNLYNLKRDASDSEKRKAMILAFAAFYAMESISFMASFTVTFSIAHAKYFAGIGERVRFIARDGIRPLV